MKTISMLELRRRSPDVIKWLKNGEQMALTFRGKKIATLLPEEDPAQRPIPQDDPIRRLCELAEPGLGSMTNEEMDQLLYGNSKNIS